VRGTRYTIHVDPADGLLYAGEAGVQLTWMDAKVGGWVVTPRIGKPVDINALWYNALCSAAYHQGIVWAWLIGPFVSAHLRVYGDREQARSFLQPLFRHLADHGVGSVSEIFDGDPPFTPRGVHRPGVERGRTAARLAHDDDRRVR
jgi:glycogen debranching enzyme